jgi:DNA invertase Pin-like site-specific DNA recombinase
LATVLEFIRPGDVLTVVKLDRLGRNTRDVLNLVHELDKKGAHLRVLEPVLSSFAFGSRMGAKKFLAPDYAASGGACECGGQFCARMF